MQDFLVISWNTPLVACIFLHSHSLKGSSFYEENTRDSSDIFHGRQGILTESMYTPEKSFWAVTRNVTISYHRRSLIISQRTPGQLVHTSTIVTSITA